MPRLSLGSIFRFALAALMVSAGVLHFTSPAFFVAIVPAYLPRPELLVQVSGVAEIAGGLGILVPATRRAAGIGLMLLYIAIVPANVNMAVHHLPMNGKPVAPAFLWARLALQPLLVYWAWACAVRRRQSENGQGLPRSIAK
jgi:uncharacterized membrane protein